MSFETMYILHRKALAFILFSIILFRLKVKMRKKDYNGDLDQTRLLIIHAQHQSHIGNFDS